MKTEKQVRTWWIVNHGGMNQDLTVRTTKRELGPIWFQQIEVICKDDYLKLQAQCSLLAEALEKIEQIGPRAGPEFSTFTAREARLHYNKFKEEVGE